MKLLMKNNRSQQINSSNSSNNKRSSHLRKDSQNINKKEMKPIKQSQVTRALTIQQAKNKSHHKKVRMVNHHQAQQKMKKLIMTRKAKMALVLQILH